MKLALALVLVAGCAQEGVLVPPGMSEARSALLLSPSRPAFAFAVDIDAGRPATIELPEHTNGAPLLSSLFTCPLESIALSPGQVPLQVDRGRPFPRGDQVHRWVQSDEDAWIQIEASALRAEMEPVRLDQPEAPPCNDFPVVRGPVQHLLPGEAFPDAMVALESEVALLLTLNSLLWVRPDHSIEPIEDAQLETTRAAIGLAEADSALIVPSIGPMLSGHPDRGLEVYGPAPPNAGAAMALARSPLDQERLELFLLSERGLAVYDGSAWTLLDQTVRPVESGAKRPGLWLGPAKVLFVAPHPVQAPELLYWRRGAWRVISVPNAPRSLAALPDGQVLVGTEDGLTLRVDLEAGAVEQLSGWARPLRPVWVILPLEDSFLLSGWGGFSNEYEPTEGFCSSSGFTPPLLGTTFSVGQTVGPRREILGAGRTGFSEFETNLVLFRLGRSSALPDRCPSE